MRGRRRRRDWTRAGDADLEEGRWGEEDGGGGGADQEAAGSGGGVETEGVPYHPLHLPPPLPPHPPHFLLVEQGGAGLTHGQHRRHRSRIFYLDFHHGGWARSPSAPP